MTAWSSGCILVACSRALAAERDGESLSHDGLRAILSSQSFTTNVAVLRAPTGRR
jgi:hypothetical protein